MLLLRRRLVIFATPRSTRKREFCFLFTVSSWSVVTEATLMREKKKKRRGPWVPPSCSAIPAKPKPRAKKKKRKRHKKRVRKVDSILPSPTRGKKPKSETPNTGYALVDGGEGFTPSLLRSSSFLRESGGSIQRTAHTGTTASQELPSSSSARFPSPFTRSADAFMKSNKARSTDCWEVPLGCLNPFPLRFPKYARVHIVSLCYTESIVSNLL